MKQIRMIKENPFLTYEIGELIEVDKNGKVNLISYFDHKYHFNYITNILLDAEQFVEKGYAEWVEDEESLVDQVDSIIDIWERTYGSMVAAPLKYKAIMLYDHIIDELNGDWKPKQRGIDIRHGQGTYNYYWDANSNCYPLNKAKNSDICEAIIECKKMRPYLNLIFGVEDNEK